MNKTIKKFSRFQKIQSALKIKKLSGLIVTNPSNIKYLIDFSQVILNKGELFMIITLRKIFLLSSPLLYDMFKHLNGMNVVKITQSKKLTWWIKQIAMEEKIKKVGYEEENMTVAGIKALKKKLKFLSFVETKKIIENIRLYKDDNELNYIKKACQITDLTYSYILNQIKKNISEKQLSHRIEYFIKERASDIPFPPIVAFGKNASIPHYISSNESKLKPNSLILLDFGVKYKNYCSDMTRVVFFGKPDQTFNNIYNTVYNAQQKAISYLNKDIKKRGKADGANIDKKIKEFIKKKGYSIYPHGLGHGIGIDIHEEPRLRVGHKSKLIPEMVFTIEPAIYIDGWGGIRIEDTVALRKYGVKILTKSPKKLQENIIP